MIIKILYIVVLLAGSFTLAIAYAQPILSEHFIRFGISGGSIFLFGTMLKILFGNPFKKDK